MKFTTLFALLGSASALGSADVKTLALKDQMKSLQNMVKTAQTHKASDMISAISDRKSELEYQLALQGSSGDKKSVAKELTYLLDLVQNIEQNNFDGATKTLAQRKNKLFKYQMHLEGEGDAPVATEETDETATTEETEEAVVEEEESNFTLSEDGLEVAAVAAVEEPAEDATKEVQATYVKYLQDFEAAIKVQSDLAAAALATDLEKAEDKQDVTFKTKSDALKAQLANQEEITTAAELKYDIPAVEEEKKGSNVGGIIGGIAAAVVLVGGCVYYKKQQSDDAEGGQKED